MIVNMKHLKVRIEFASLEDARSWANVFGGRIVQHKETKLVLWYSHAFTVLGIMLDLPKQGEKIDWSTTLPNAWKGFELTDSVSGS